MKILQLSDLHYRSQYLPATNAYQEMLTKMENPLIYLDLAIEKAKSMTAIDLVLITGDLTEDGEVCDYRFLREYFIRQFPTTPVMVTLGNHDIKENFYQGWLKNVPTSNYYNFICEMAEFYLFSFDSSIYGNADGFIDKNQLNWLEEMLATHQDKPVLFMTHHHLIQGQYATANLPQSDQLWQVLKRHNILAVLNGHTHCHYQATIGEIPYYTVDGLSFLGQDEGGGLVRFVQHAGFSLYEIKAGQFQEIATEIVTSGKLLQKVDMRLC